MSDYDKYYILTLYLANGNKNFAYHVEMGIKNHVSDVEFQVYKIAGGESGEKILKAA